MKIMIVEDSLFVQNYIRKNIEHSIPDCGIITASDGEKGYSLYLESKPDIILTDILMPRLNGHQLIRKIRETDDITKIIVISADVQKTTRNEVEALGIVEFINKPLNAEKADHLIKLIKEVKHAE